MISQKPGITLAEFLTEHGIPFRTGGSHHHVSSNWLGTDCPMCSPGSDRFRLGLHPERFVASCWSCGKMRFGDALAELTGLPVGVCLRQLNRDERPRETERRPGRLILPAHGPLLKIHRDYLRSRDFDPDELAKLWDLRGIAYLPRFAWRILIPVTRKGKIVSWTTRAVTDEGKRYIAAGVGEESWPAKSLLYGAEFARHAVVIVEGPADAWRVGPGATALLGVANTRAQVSLLARYPVRCICFDSAPDAQRRASQLCQELQAFPGTTANVMLDANDPGSASPREIEMLRKAYLE